MGIKKAAKGDDLDSSIKKLMESLHGEEIDEKIEARMSELRSEMGPRTETDVAPLISGMREMRDRISRLESALSKVSQSARPAQDRDDKLWSAMQTEIDKLSSEVKEDAAKSRDMIEDLHSQLSGIRDIIKEMRQIHEEIKSFDTKGASREMESMKQRLNWLEQNSGVQDIEKLKERIEEIEASLRGVRSGEPLVIE
jgi:SMC interacting uncharacterized protein involved in chromosome segregation